MTSTTSTHRVLTICFGVFILLSHATMRRGEEKPAQAPATGKSEQTEGAKRFQHGEVKDGLAAFLMCRGNRFKVGEPIPLSYGVIFVGPAVDDRESQDTSKLKMRVWWLQNRPESLGNYSWFEVTGPGEQNVPYHGGTATLPRSAPLDEFSVYLHHGQFVGATHLDLRRNFDLNKPGTYKVRWGYKPWFEGGSWTGKLMSNEVQFEIVPDPVATCPSQ